MPTFPIKTRVFGPCDLHICLRVFRWSQLRCFSLGDSQRGRGPLAFFLRPLIAILAAVGRRGSRVSDGSPSHWSSSDRTLGYASPRREFSNEKHRSCDNRKHVKIRIYWPWVVIHAENIDLQFSKIFKNCVRLTLSGLGTVTGTTGHVFRVILHPILSKSDGYGPTFEGWLCLRPSKHTTTKNWYKSARA
jgi:hypothetical protein